MCAELRNEMLATLVYQTEGYGEIPFVLARVLRNFLVEEGSDGHCGWWLVLGFRFLMVKLQMFYVEDAYRF